MPSLIIIPLVALFIKAARGPEELIAIVAIITFGGGILRKLYALFFEAKLAEIPANEGVLPEVAQKYFVRLKESERAAAAAINSGWFFRAADERKLAYDKRSC